MRTVREVIGNSGVGMRRGFKSHIEEGDGGETFWKNSSISWNTFDFDCNAESGDRNQIV